MCVCVCVFQYLTRKNAKGVSPQCIACVLKHKPYIFSAPYALLFIQLNNIIHVMFNYKDPNARKLLLAKIMANAEKRHTSCDKTPVQRLENDYYYAFLAKSSHICPGIALIQRRFYRSAKCTTRVPDWKRMSCGRQIRR
jgi:hypothetical protein